MYRETREEGTNCAPWVKRYSRSRVYGLFRRRTLEQTCSRDKISFARLRSSVSDACFGSLSNREKSESCRAVNSRLPVNTFERALASNESCVLSPIINASSFREYVSLNIILFLLRVYNDARAVERAFVFITFYHNRFSR